MKNVFTMETFKLSIKRLFAFMLDWYLASLFTEIPVIFFQSINGKDLVLYNSLEGLTLTQGVIATIVAVVLFFCYFVLYPIKHDGNTLGRKLLKLKIVKMDGSNLTMVDLIKKDGIGLLLLQGNLTSVNIYILSLIQMYFLTSIVPYFYSVYFAIMMISIFLFYFTKEHRMIQDYISKTKTIQL